MNTKTLSPRALSVIDQYIHFKIGSAVSPIPYFNNKRTGVRNALRATIGKGSPKDIYEEAHSILIKNHIQEDALADESLAKLLVDNGIGIDCSGFAYYVLNAESSDIGRGPIDKHISFVNCKGLIGKMRCSFRPVENCDVATLADDANSRVVSLNEAQPGDMITMVGDENESERDHILIIHQIDYQNFIPTALYYSHAVAYPEDGIYGTGVKQGKIEIVHANTPVTEGVWTENGKIDSATRIFTRSQKSKTEVRRMKWM